MSEGRELDVATILGGIGEKLPEGHRSGLVALVGRPNVGKSTLLNHVVGKKVAITTPVPGTTRNTIRAVLTRDDAQLVFLDTPGLAKPRTLLTKRLNAMVRDSWAAVDLIAFLVDVSDGIGHGDRYMAEELADVPAPVVAIANKADLVRDKQQLLPGLSALEQLNGGGVFHDIVPVSAKTGENVDTLVDVLVSHLPEGPRLFSDLDVTDQPERQIAAEIVREKLISKVREELPHSIAVTVDEIVADDRRDDLVRIEAIIHVERDSQKGIVIGKRGAILKAAATEAREELEVLLGVKVFLTTHVKVAKDWQRDPKQLGRLGY